MAHSEISKIIAEDDDNALDAIRHYSIMSVDVMMYLAVKHNANKCIMALLPYFNYHKTDIDCKQIIHVKVWDVANHPLVDRMLGYGWPYHSHTVVEAVDKNRVDVLEIFLQYKLELNIILKYAIRHSVVPIVKFTLEHGAVIDKDTKQMLDVLYSSYKLQAIDEKLPPSP